MTNNDNACNPKRACMIWVKTNINWSCCSLFINILISYIFTHNEYALAKLNFISWIIVAVGSYFVISGSQNEIMRSGAIVFYYFYFIPNIIGLVIGIIVNQFHLFASVKTTINLLTLIIAGLVTIVYYLSVITIIFWKN